MSVQAVAWAIDASKTGPLPAEARLVLIVMADRADKHGRNVFLSAPTIAKRLGTTDRSVRRHLSTLRQRRLIVPGDPGAIPEYYRHDRRPVIYDLPINVTAADQVRRVAEPTQEPPVDDDFDPWADLTEDQRPDSNVIPWRGHDLTAMSARPDSTVRNDLTALSPNPVVDPPSIPNSRSSSFNSPKLGVAFARMMEPLRGLDLRLA